MTEVQSYKVKPLTWVSGTDGKSRAESVFGEYVVWNASGPGYPMHYDVWLKATGDFEYMVDAGFKTDDEGRAAAYADLCGKIAAAVE